MRASLLECEETTRLYGSTLRVDLVLERQKQLEYTNIQYFREGKF